MALVVAFGLCSNVWKFLVKQKKFKILPLVAFYCLAVPLACERFHFAVWSVPTVFINMELVIQLTPLILKPMIGLLQSWVVTELCLTIKKSFSLASHKNHRPVSTDKRIQIGRIVVVVFIFCFTVAATVNFYESGQRLTSYGERLAYFERATNTFVFSMQVIACAFLSSSIFALWVLLRGHDTFEREKTTLLVILAYFDMTYIVRMLFTRVIMGSALVPWLSFQYYMLVILVLPLVCDLVPIGLIALIHAHNFKTQQLKHQSYIAEARAGSVSSQERRTEVFAVDIIDCSSDTRSNEETSQVSPGDRSSSLQVGDREGRFEWRQESKSLMR